MHRRKQPRRYVGNLLNGFSEAYICRQSSARLVQLFLALQGFLSGMEATLLLLAVSLSWLGLSAARS